MKKSLSILSFIVLVFTFSVFSQTVQPEATPPPIPEVDDTLVKISTALVQFDVVVTDKKGNQITDLKPEDFEIFVNDEKQDITNFSYISTKIADSVNKAGARKNNKPSDKYSVAPPPAKLKLEEVRRTYAIVVDDLGLSFESMNTVRQTIKKFVNEQMQDGDLVAIIRTGGGVGALQSFTADKRQLIAAIDKIKWNSQGRAGIGALNPIEQDMKEQIASTGKSGRTIAESEADKDIQAQIEDFRSENFSVGTLGAVDFIIRGMRELPGRKALMLFSDGFPLTYQGKPGRVLDQLRVLADTANRSSVVIYTLDPRGLLNPFMLSAEDVGTDSFGADSNAGRFDSDPASARARAFRESQQSLQYLASETGGNSYINQNNLNVGLQEAVDDQNGYYLIGYQPDSETFDPKINNFNKVSIKVKGDNLKVRSRSGFFGFTDKKPEAVKKTPEQQIYGALTSPFGANDISLSLNALFAEHKNSGTFIRSLVTIEAKDLKFTRESDGSYKAVFDLLAMTFGDNGIPVDETSKNYTIKLGENAYRKILETGFIYDLIVPINKAGAYQFRVALRDPASEKVGSASQFIEIPNLKKNQLTLSSIILDNYTTDQWKKILSGIRQKDLEENKLDNALRRFKRGTVLRYDYIVYNAKTNPTKLETRARLFRDGRLLIEGKPREIDAEGQTDLQRIENGGAITLGNDLSPGNYALQIIVVDNQAKAKNQVTSRWIDFEIVE